MKEKMIKDEMLSMDDGQLVSQFFAQFKETEIPDNGFSDRVIRQIRTLPAAEKAGMWHFLSGTAMERILKVLCGVGCILLFIYADGFNVLKAVLTSVVSRFSLPAIGGAVGGEGGGLPLVAQAYIAFLTLFIVAAYNVVMVARGTRR